ncbi:ABC transporter ATP-binding protein [Halorubrum sp. Boch-26]|uniref:ABC transporter ATP-binding protein n=1 Tax=Halorubrum sp. Boch-26 TaxID=2994426 RepID=UPI0024694628|nr:ABC transporter ATP-binding protein [Halorubrum sp. Boch-26]
MLEVEDLNVGYGDLQVLWDVSMTIAEDDDVVALVGPNGTGKTTLMKTLSGIVEPTSGRIELFGEDTAAYDADEIVSLGFVQVSEGRNLFGEMSVYENLRMGAYRHRDEFEDTLEEVYEMFPVLAERRDQEAGTLSGGEQQMLAIGRGLMSQPDLLALDEPSGALAPQLAERVFEKIQQISDDVTVLLVEQHVDRALGLADRAYLLENGRITQTGTGEEMLESDHVRKAYLSG